MILLKGLNMKPTHREQELRQRLCKLLGDTIAVNEWVYTSMPSLGHRTPLGALEDDYWYGVLIMDILPRIESEAKK